MKNTYGKLINFDNFDERCGLRNLLQILCQNFQWKIKNSEEISFKNLKKLKNLHKQYFPISFFIETLKIFIDILLNISWNFIKICRQNFDRKLMNDFIQKYKLSEEFGWKTDEICSKLRPKSEISTESFQTFDDRWKIYIESVISTISQFFNNLQNLTYIIKNNSSKFVTKISIECRSIERSNVWN